MSVDIYQMFTFIEVYSIQLEQYHAFMKIYWKEWQADFQNKPTCGKAEFKIKATLLE